GPASAGVVDLVARPCETLSGGFADFPTRRPQRGHSGEPRHVHLHGGLRLRGWVVARNLFLMTIALIDINDDRHYRCKEPSWIEICGMRVTKKKAAENRERILKAASRLIRERGISGAGVDALTGAAGMTHGSLYSQFGSKERLVEEALGYAIG